MAKPCFMWLLASVASTALSMEQRDYDDVSLFQITDSAKYDKTTKSVFESARSEEMQVQKAGEEASLWPFDGSAPKWPFPPLELPQIPGIPGIPGITAAAKKEKATKESSSKKAKKDSSSKKETEKVANAEIAKVEENSKGEELWGPGGILKKKVVRATAPAGEARSGGLITDERAKKDEEYAARQATLDEQERELRQKEMALLYRRGEVLEAWNRQLVDFQSPVDSKVVAAVDDRKAPPSWYPKPTEGVTEQVAREAEVSQMTTLVKRVTSSISNMEGALDKMSKEMSPAIEKASTPEEEQTLKGTYQAQFGNILITQKPAIDLTVQQLAAAIHNLEEREKIARDDELKAWEERSRQEELDRHSLDTPR